MRTHVDAARPTVHHEAVSELRWCSGCREHHWRAETCRPEWLAWFVDDYEPGEPLDPADARHVRARDADDAATRAMEQRDDDRCEGYSEETEVVVAPVDDLTERMVFVVSAEPIVQYIAHEKAET